MAAELTMTSSYICTDSDKCGIPYAFSCLATTDSSSSTSQRIQPLSESFHPSKQPHPDYRALLGFTEVPDGASLWTQLESLTDILLVQALSLNHYVLAPYSRNTPQLRGLRRVVGMPIIIIRLRPSNTHSPIHYPHHHRDHPPPSPSQ